MQLTPPINSSPVHSGSITQDRDRLLSQAKLITKVINDTTMAKASSVSNELKKLATVVERERVECKAPVLKLERDIDKAAADFVAPVLSENRRILGLITARVRELKEANQIEEAKRQPPLPLPAQPASRPVPPIVTAPVTAPVSGIATREVWDYEILDIWKVAATHPKLVEITPKSAEIRKAIDGGMRDIPGLRIFQETKVNNTGR